MSLNYYGKIIRQYIGSGKLTLDSEYSTEFELVQISNGGIYVLCKICQFIPSFKPGCQIKLFGKTSDDNEIQFEGTSININIGEVTTVIAHGNYAYVGSLPKKNNDLSIIFGLTNLTMLGTAPYEYNEQGRKCFSLQYHFNLEGFDVFIRQVPDYKEVINHIKCSRAIDVSCIAVFQNVSIENIDDIKRIMNHLCYLLTLAKGCNINWIYYDVLFNGSFIYSQHENRITKPFGTLQLISKNPGKDLECLINKTYNRFIEVKEFLELEKGIDEYTDAKMEGDHLAFRALKLVVTMEHLKSCFLRNNNKEYIIEKEKFEAKIDQCLVLPVIEAALRSIFADEDKGKIKSMAEHSRGFNYCSFGQALSEICKHFNVDTNSKERKRFKDIRDSLVHKVKFNSEFGSHWVQYCFLMTFIGRIILSILGYDGFFYDWTKPPGDEGEDMEMRIKLKYKEYKSKGESTSQTGGTLCDSSKRKKKSFRGNNGVR